MMLHTAAFLFLSASGCLDQKSAAFRAPVRIEVGSTLPSITHLAPVLYDFDHDGVQEMIVGDLRGHLYKSAKRDSGLTHWTELKRIKSIDGEDLLLRNS